MRSYERYHRHGVTLMATSALIFSALFFWKNQRDIKVEDFLSFASALSMASFAIVIMMGPPYELKKGDRNFEIQGNDSSFITQPFLSNQQTKIENYKRNIPNFQGRCCAYTKTMLTNVFSLRMIKHLLPILSAAFMTAMFESVAYLFIATKIEENIEESVNAYTFFMLAPF